MLGAQLVEIPKTKFAKNPKDLMIMLGQMILETLTFLEPTKDAIMCSSNSIFIKFQQKLPDMGQFMQLWLIHHS
jgi:hypothetical protein